ncbi:MAG: mandelate racemase [Proteobacteria bacterium]|nr:mandelate racemase [Pseudomonadota bacterium]
MSRTGELKIRDVRTHPVVAPLPTPVTTSVGAITEAPLLLIDVETEEGVTGRAYLFAYQRFALRPLDDLVRSLAELIKGDWVAPFEIDRELRAGFTLLGGARGLAGLAVAGIDMALWDALAIGRGVPLAVLLGGRPKPIPAYNSLGMVSARVAAGEAAKALEGGFRAVKIKIGWPTLDEDLAVIRAFRKNLPGDAALMVDFNQSLTATEAIRRGHALDGEGVAWIEEPVRADDFASCARVAAALTTPVQIGENFAGPQDMHAALRADAADCVMPDVQQIGGVSGWLRAAALAQAAGKEMSSHIFVEISAHLLAVTPTCHWLEYLDVAGGVLQEPLRIANGLAQAADRPGSGLAWDAAAVERYRVG